MDLGIVSIGSSSSGNSYLITTKKTHLILDVGVSCRRITDALAANGISPDGVQGILLTHEHVDHVKSIRAASRKMRDAAVYASRGTMDNCANFEYVPEERRRVVSAQDEMMIGDIHVKAFRLSHDAAEPIGYSFEHDGSKITVATDTGVVTDEIFEEIGDSDVLALEANHEKNILEMGPYPYSLKRRILSDVGHLSNDTAGNTLTAALDRRRNVKKGRAKILLAHLSSTNNTPEQARLTVGNILEENDFFSGRDFDMGVASKSERSGLILA